MCARALCCRRGFFTSTAAVPTPPSNTSERAASRWLKQERQYIKSTLFSNEQFQSLKRKTRGDILDVMSHYPRRNRAAVEQQEDDGDDGVRHGMYQFTSDSKNDLLRNGEIVVSMEQELARERNVRMLSARISPDGERIALVVDFTENQSKPHLLVKDLRSNSWLMQDRVMQCEWFNSNKLICALARADRDSSDQAQVCNQVIAFDFESRTGEVLYEETDPKNFIVLGRTKDDKFVHFNSMTTNSTEIHLILEEGEGGNVTTEVVCPRSPDLSYFVDHLDGLFYVVTNQAGCTEFRVDVVPDDHSFADCITVVPHDSQCSIEEIELRSGGFMALFCRDVSSIHQFIKVYQVQRIDSDELVLINLKATLKSNSLPHVRPSSSLDDKSSRLGISVSSPTHPVTDIVVDLTALQGDHDLMNFVVESSQVAVKTANSFCSWDVAFPRGHDGELVPMTILKPKSPQKIKGRGLVVAYGAYGSSLKLDFDAFHLALVKDGWSVFLAHVRGGSEKGQRWYKQGKLLNKMNSFHDLKACVEHIYSSKLVNSGQLAAIGNSAGGLLIAGFVNQRPEWFRAIVLQVPFVSVMTSMLDESGKLTSQDYEEWGNPSTSDEVRSLISKYDPMLTLTEANAQRYPHALILAAKEDTRVDFKTISQFVCRLREFQQRHNASASTILFDVDERFGHFGELTLDAAIEEHSRDYGFLKWALEKDVDELVK
eukprot:TRINITY_DN21175_c0_g1_i2.p1 TRINITY_DN21175_c0_g1~~TRINITY_DN21175_c0_g1_i2.p1  ORF type:complete len:713 (-),score=191.88 TRINITY_DN21175_c0_g1_i2:1315-3453(-)